jgi:hypothetical protein
MGMPNNALSDVAFRYTWRGLNQADPTQTEDYEEAGVALNNTSEGMQYQLWTFSTNGTDILVDAPNQPAPTILLSPGSIVSVRGCFDQNMNPFVAYSRLEQWNYWWFDTTVGHMVTSQLPGSVNSVVCTLDDKRPWEASKSDICLIYTNNGNLYYRRQRDRYATEYLLKASINGTLVKASMNGIERLQIKLRATVV